MLPHSAQLKAVLSEHFKWHGARLSFMALFIQALYKVGTVNLSKLAVALNPDSSKESNYRRLQRFFSGYSLNEDEVSRFVVSLIPRPATGYVLSLDRTCWEFGKVSINLLVLGIIYEGVAIPVFSFGLDKKGNSNTLERIAILELFISLFGKSCIDCLVADREFIGKEWFQYLQREKISFRIRIKKNSRIGQGKETLRASTLFQAVPLNQELILHGKRDIWGLKLYLVGTKLGPNDYLIVVTDQKPASALTDYAKRWQIETLFGILKSRGFCLEDTHLTEPVRLEKLIALLTIATLWAVKVGIWLHQQKAIPLKKHGRKAISLFRSGLDFLQSALFDIQIKLHLWADALTLLSCT